MTLKKRCSCGCLNDRDRLFCSDCGSSLVQAQEVEDEELLDGEAARVPAERDGRPREQDGTLEPGSSYECECLESVPDADGRQCCRCGGAINRHENFQKADPSGAEPLPLTSTSYPVARVSGRSFDLSDGLLLGRRTDCRALKALLVGYRGVSRHHAWLMAMADQLLILDLESRNGTWINGRRLKPFEVLSLTKEDLPVRLYLGASLPVDVVMEERL